MAFADELFECVWSFCGVGAWRANFQKKKKKKKIMSFLDFLTCSLMCYNSAYMLKWFHK